MMLGLSLSTFTMLHVIISLVGIVSGIVVLFGLLGSNRMPGWTALFLLTTILTSVTGFGFPFTTLSAVAHDRHSIAGAAGDRLYRALRHEAFRRLALDLCGDGDDRALFQHLRADYPELPQDSGLDGAGAGQSAIRTGVRVVQGIVLLFFVLVIIGAVRRFRPA